VVREWKSDSNVLKQQGHLYDMNAISYSPDGQFIATGGQDGKLNVVEFFWVSGGCRGEAKG
jgi:periodic tryptophan protein 2